MRTEMIWVATLAATVTPPLHAELVYQNSTVPSGQRLSIGTIEVGDEILLGGVDRLLTDFDFEYFGIGFSGNEQVRVRFYLNNGDPYHGDVNAMQPLTEFFDSGLFDVTATAGNTLNFSTSDGSLPSNIILPERFTFSVQFSGIEAAESAGVNLYNPPTIGSSPGDYWYNDPGEGWQTRTNADYAINFGARVQAVPEPSTFGLGVLGMLAGWFLFRRKRT